MVNYIDNLFWLFNILGGLGGGYIPTTSELPVFCLFENLIGDGLCQDEANTNECNFDGGDCCGSDVNTTYCVSCQCVMQSPGDFSTTMSATGWSIWLHHIQICTLWHKAL